MNSPRRFWVLLVLITAGAVLTLIGWNLFVPASDALSAFILVCIAAFIGINIFAYYAARSAVRSSSKYRFIHLMMGLILLKMILCIAMVVVHVKVNNPQSKAFVLPFLTIYLIYTLFEIFVLEKIARTKPTTIS